MLEDRCLVVERLASRVWAALWAQSIAALDLMSAAVWIWVRARLCQHAGQYLDVRPCLSQSGWLLFGCGFLVAYTVGSLINS